MAVQYYEGIGRRKESTALPLVKNALRWTLPLWWMAAVFQVRRMRSRWVWRVHWC